MGVAVERQKVLQDDAGKVRAEGATRLVSDVAMALDNAEDSDVTFVCKDGDKVHSSRWFLSVRCEVFKGMFRHEMPESKSSEVVLPQISSSVLRCIFEYLYTGSMKSYPPQSWKEGFELISASHYFMISAVGVVAQEYLWNTMSEVRKEANRDLVKDLVMDMLSEALEFHEIWEGKDAMLLELTDDLRKTWIYGKNNYQKLSGNAMVYVLSNLKPDEPGNGQSRQQALVEYYTLRQIVLWHVYQRVLPSGMDSETRTKLQQAMPTPEDEPSLWRGIFESRVDVSEFACGSSNASRPSDPTAVLTSLLGINICKETFERQLEHIDWRRIPTMLLLKVVWPLKMIRPDVIFDSVAVQALQAPVNTWACSTFDWTHTEELSSDSATVICKSRDGLRSVSGTALALAPMSRPDGIYEWQFEVKKNSVDFISLGFFCDTHCAVNVNDFQSRVPDWPSETRLVCIECGQKRTYMSRKEVRMYFRKHWKTIPAELPRKSSIKFTLNVPDKTCRVSCAIFTRTWKTLPSAVYYPMVQFRDGKHGSIKLKLVKGF